MQVYKDKDIRLLNTDSFEFMKTLPDKSIDVIVADPPYFLSTGGFSNSGGKMVSVDKGKWDQPELVDPASFYQRFISEAMRILNDNGTIWMFGTMHNIYLIGYLLQHSGFKLLNNITWQKSNPAPNLSRRMFTHSTETIIWAKKENGKQLFNYDIMRAENDNKQMKDVWTTSTINRSERRFGKHPTQKLLALFLRILRASTDENSCILDPFMGTGTTAVAGRLLNRRVIGIDNNMEYFDIAIQRIQNYQTEKVGKIK
jgi:site-specific DNA-methyltransferase (adenine-specific)